MRKKLVKILIHTKKQLPMYWKSILTFMTLPALVVLSLYLVLYVVKKYKDVFEHVKKKYEQ